jgi:AcrR family transcriptional regulator
MARIVKQAEQRKDEILDAAERLFAAKGYAATTTADLLHETGIARGTLYYHFTSKEQVLDGLIHRHSDRLVAGVEQIADTEGPALPRMVACVAGLTPHDEHQATLMTQLSQAGDAILFHKSLDDLVVRLAPVIARVAEQGVTEGVFYVNDPLSAVRILLAAAHALLDNPALAWSPDERVALTMGIVDAAERILGADPGSFAKTLSAAHP